MRGLLNIGALAVIGGAIYVASVRWLGLTASWGYALGASGGIALFTLAISYISARNLSQKFLQLSAKQATVAETAITLTQANQRAGCLYVVAMLGSGVASWILMYHFLPWTPISTLGVIGFHVTLLLLSIFVLFVFVMILATIFTPDNVLQNCGVPASFSTAVLLQKKANTTLGTQRTAVEPTTSANNAILGVQQQIQALEDAAQANEPAARPEPASSPASLIEEPDPGQPQPLHPITVGGQEEAEPASSSQPSTPTAASPLEGHQVFISYSSHDRQIAETVCATLESQGVGCWIAPRDVTPGVPYAVALIDALSSSRILVLVFSSSSNVSPQVNREVERAVAKGVPILPLRIEAVDLSKSMEYFISTSHWLDAVTRPLESHLSRLAQAVNLLLDKLEGNPASKLRAITEAVQQTGGEVKADTRTTPKRERVHRRDVFKILIDSLCCVMSADGIATSSEKAVIRDLMGRFKSPFNSEEIDECIEDFCERVANEGFPAVVDAVACDIAVFKRLGKSDLLLKCLADMSWADGKQQDSEMDMIDRFRSIVS